MSRSEKHRRLRAWTKSPNGPHALFAGWTSGYVDIDQWDQAAHHAVAHLTVGQEIAAEGLLDARPYITYSGKLRVGWTMLRPRVEWGSKPLRDVPTERMMDEARRRREALQNPDAPPEIAP